MKQWIPSYRSHVTDWHGHFTFARWLAEYARPHVYVELGVRFGDSFFAFAEAMAASPTSTFSKNLIYPRKCIGIDLWEPSTGFADFPDYPKGKPEDPYRAVFEHTVNMASTDPRIFLLKQHTLEASKSVSSILAHPEKIDILHIDANHTYDSVKDDFEAYRPLMADTGIVLFHDSRSLLSSYGVEAYLHHLKKQYPIITMPHSEGLSVLFMPKAYYMIPEVDKFKEDYMINNFVV